MNAGAALYIGGKADSIKDGIALAADIIDSGKALDTLEKFIKVSNRPEVRSMTTILDQLADHAQRARRAGKSIRLPLRNEIKSGRLYRFQRDVSPLKTR